MNNKKIKKINQNYKKQKNTDKEYIKYVNNVLILQIILSQILLILATLIFVKILQNFGIYL